MVDKVGVLFALLTTELALLCELMLIIFDEPTSASLRSNCFSAKVRFNCGFD
jgi:hypothetical protein